MLNEEKGISCKIWLSVASNEGLISACWLVDTLGSEVKRIGREEQHSIRLSP